MPTILAVSGSPSPSSFTQEVLGLAARRLRGRGHPVDTLRLRELPPAELLAADTEEPAVRDAVDRLLAADAVLLASPVYKAAYSGLLKAFLDLLPQYALEGKVVMPLASGGSMAHALAVDYGLRPVLASMRPVAITDAVFVPSDAAVRGPDGRREPDPLTRARLDDVTDRFEELLTAVTSAERDAQPAAPRAAA
ncbi:NADPH-dependent FMN reductase [Streptomyces sp. ICBB 8177]|uniref:NADPH-dependent FMN reductase n=1 Tax=Streptomyces sp. ICBB 8177 TaxID=563922 RepID=UPI000D674174|nr:NADPH-dependent FMN reductase [Streptomyces sp. ICBB 8177]PWI45383.1 FMN reductase (NADPH) [Streptomyces sp. ICBB 8177]